LQRSRVPVMVSAGSVLVNVALNLALVRVMGYRGLALGTSITAIVNASVQLFLLRREINGLEGSKIAASFARVVVASAVMGAVSWGAYAALEGALPGDALIVQVLRLTATIGLSLAALAATAQLLRIPEFADARDLVIRRLKRTTG
jgi:putative peptidoglycan lipid II flippase